MNIFILQETVHVSQLKIFYTGISKKYTDTKLCTKPNSSSTKNDSVEKQYQDTH